eukprot:737875_1
MTENTKQTPEVPTPIKIVSTITEEEKKFWDSLMELDTGNVSSCMPVSDQSEDDAECMCSDLEIKSHNSSISLTQSSTVAVNYSAEVMPNDSDGGYVTKRDHCTNKSTKSKLKLPSPTTDNNTLIEIGMWKLMKQMKQNEKHC